MIHNLKLILTKIEDYRRRQSHTTNNDENRRKADKEITIHSIYRSHEINQTPLRHPATVMFSEVICINCYCYITHRAFRTLHVVVRNTCR